MNPYTLQTMSCSVLHNLYHAHAYIPLSFVWYLVFPEEGEDFASNGSLTFNFQMGAATQFQACIDIWIMNDMDFEGDHSFEVTLGPNTPALRGGTGGFGSPTSTTITIQDHEGIFVIYGFDACAI